MVWPYSGCCHDRPETWPGDCQLKDQPPRGDPGRADCPLELLCQHQSCSPEENREVQWSPDHNRGKCFNLPLEIGTRGFINQRNRSLISHLCNIMKVKKWARWPKRAASWRFLAPSPSGMQDIPLTGVPAAIWLPEGWKQLPTDPTPSYWYPVTFAFEALRGQYHIPSGVFCYPWQKGLYLAKVWGSPPFSFYIFTYILIYVHPTDWKLMPCRYSGRSSLGVARSVAPPFNMIGNSSNMYSFYWKLIALWQ